MDTTPAPRLPLSSLISPASVELHLRSNHRDGVLGELVALVPELANQPEAQRTLLRALQEREQLCSTGIGDGIALPHCRNALVGLVEHPVLVFGHHEPGIPFGSVDNSPARLFFLLVAPTVSQHLQILARLSRLLRDPRLRQALLNAERAERVVFLLHEAELSLEKG
ncbi:MAG: PTS sugar transporter subunit IIA [Candidatus Omnitrophica bacterium]|nr:PTS sugar transporter subunit IIA [Candidatus Omnitrophota bacterium]